jgi:hypothetical protein
MLAWTIDVGQVGSEIDADQLAGAVRELVEEHEARQSVEAWLAKDIDKLEWLIPSSEPEEHAWSDHRLRLLGSFHVRVAGLSTGLKAGPAQSARPAQVASALERDLF